MDDVDFRLSFPKLAKRFGNVRRGRKLRFHFAAKDRTEGGPAPDNHTGWNCHGCSQLGKQSFKSKSTFSKRFANFGNEKK